MKKPRFATTVAVLSFCCLTFRPAIADPWISFSTVGSVNGVATTDYGGEGDILLATSTLMIYNPSPSGSSTVGVSTTFEDWDFDVVGTTSASYSAPANEYTFYTHSHQISATDGTEHYFMIEANSGSGALLGTDTLDFAMYY